MNAPNPVRSPESRAAVDLKAACDRLVLRSPSLRECDVEALRAELVGAMAAMCDELGLVRQAVALRRAVGAAFNRPEDMEDG